VFCGEPLIQFSGLWLSLDAGQVRFFCDDSGRERQRGQQAQAAAAQEPPSGNIIVSLKEAPTCEYEMHFASSLLCQHR